MSRYYEMTVEIKGFNRGKIIDIKIAASAEWGFPINGWYVVDQQDDQIQAMGVTGRSNLCGGEDEEEFAERLARAIVKANGGPCGVIVRATYLDDQPYEEYTFDKEDYERLLLETHDA